MKKLIFSVIVFLSVAIFTEVSATVRNANAGVKSAPGNSTKDDVQYYYLPEIEAYYFVPRKQFIYQSNGYWTFSSSLPAAHNDFNWRSAEKVVINEPGAYRYYAQHKAKYAPTAKNNVASQHTGAKKSVKSRDKDKS